MSSGTLKYQKIIKVGNSLAITLDRDFVTKTGVKAGDQVAVNYQPEDKVVSYAPVAQSDVLKLSEKMGKYEATAKTASSITPELKEWTENFYKENKKAMDKLANL